MKGIKTICVALAALVVAGCGTSTKTGTLVGGGGGAAIGALIGGLVGKSGKSALIGTAIGGAVGTGAGYLIGKKMDKAKAAAAQVENATVESVTDANGLQAVKVSFDNGILFSTGKHVLQPSAQTSLSQFANKVLNVYTDCDVAIYGYASSDGSEELNLNLSNSRAYAVSSYLTNTCRVSPVQIKTVKGFGEDPQYLVYNSDGSENAAASRRVEVYLYASQSMVDAANAGTLQ
ncbi:MAG: OmpA family protein [Bacteroidales bacterium]|nr:OmpA family protein [Bacteroidales bacterium]MCM1147252.1 OmpA family protein [Bacteroidales bacterium]MCM1206315.1 OmpA family protein [Bacillota bacterium]MCM1510492.1 OmpA family protein [Clostridium sp.]